MAVKIGLNGFGRIGRLVTRMLGDNHRDLELVAVNARAETSQLAHLLKYDSVHRTYAGRVEYQGDTLLVQCKPIAISRHSSPAEIPWAELGVTLVLETAGKFKKRDILAKHLENGAKKVVAGAPGKDIDATLVMGVNHDTYDPARHHIISNASCTTNCLAPVAVALHREFSVEHGLMTTIHSYTMSQRILDGSTKDIRRTRAAAMSLIPTTTGAARAVCQVIPELKGKLDGFAIRVPTPDVSLVDFTFRAGREVTKDQVNDCLRKAAEGPMQGYLAVTDEQLVSVDYTGNTYSAVVDAPLTQVMQGRMVKVLAWYDNEAGYAARMIDMAAYVASFM